MQDEIFDYVIGIWVAIILFITCPIWGLPYVVYHRLKNRR